MLSYCLKRRKDRIKIQEFQKLVMEEEYFYENVQIVKVKKSRFIKKHGVSGLLGNLWLRTPREKYHP